MDTKTKWDEIYRKGKYERKPHEDLKRISEAWKKAGVKRVLDLGCGAGRNLIYLLKQNFQVYGIDISEEACTILKRYLKNETGKIDIRIGNMFERLPYEDDFFDAVISIQVLHHGTYDEIKKVISEIRRILRKDGFLFVTLPGRYAHGKIRPFIVKTARKIAPNTYVPTIGDEAGITHFIFNKHLIKKCFQGFKIMEIWKDSKDYYCVLFRNRK